MTISFVGWLLVVAVLLLVVGGALKPHEEAKTDVRVREEGREAVRGDAAKAQPAVHDVPAAVEGEETDENDEVT